MDGPLIALEDVVLDYPGGRALGPVSLSIARGDFVALVGPSGSGKTSLLNLMGGLDVPTSGHLAVDGQDLAALSDRELSAYRSRKVGFVFQSFHLHPSRTAVQNLTIPLYFTDLPMREGRARAVELLGRLGLAGLEEREVARLSGGQRQRVAFARALMNRPQLLLADEPIGALDTGSAEAVLELMRELARQEQVTVVAATHDEQLMHEASRVVRMAAGVVVE